MTNTTGSPPATASVRSDHSLTARPSTRSTTSPGRSPTRAASEPGVTSPTVPGTGTRRPPA